jgi:hypothetical protein
MIRILSVFLFLFLFSPASFAQQDSTRRPTSSYCGYKEPKGKFYFAFGYNKNWYSGSNIHVFDQSGDYNFTLYDMKAHDRTHLNELFKVDISIPQYGYRLGYWMPNGRWGVEIKFDHAKYIINNNQTVHLRGTIHEKFYDTDTLVGADFLLLEHTDGANFLMFNGMYRRDFYRGRFIHLAGVAKFGAGIVVPRSDVTLFGQRWNHCFHVAGQIAGAELGLRAEFFGVFFIEPSVKGAYANFNRVLAVEDVLISHRFWDGMVMVDAGFQFPLGKKH